MYTASNPVTQRSTFNVQRTVGHASVRIPRIIIIVTNLINSVCDHHHLTPPEPLSAQPPSLHSQWPCLVPLESPSFSLSTSSSFSSSLLLVSNVSQLLLVLHSLYFTGYAVGSLALVADSFHMLKSASIIPFLNLSSSNFFQ